MEDNIQAPLAASAGGKFATVYEAIVALGVEGAAAVYRAGVGNRLTTARPSAW